MEQLDSGDTEHLALLSRSELGVTFSKINCWRLTQYSKCVFLDADTLVLQNVDELFDREELSAAPDIGWPDCFNTGVFVFEPSLQTFHNLLELSRVTGSFDGEYIGWYLAETIVIILFNLHSQECVSALRGVWGGFGFQSKATLCTGNSGGNLVESGNACRINSRNTNRALK